MTANKRARCVRALERLNANIENYKNNKPINNWQHDLLQTDIGKQTGNAFYKQKLEKAEVCRDALLAKGVS